MPLSPALIAFRRITRLIAAGNPLAVVLGALVEAVEAESPEIRCSIVLLGETGRHLALAAAPSLPDFYNRAIDGLEIGPGVGSCGTAIHTNRRVVVSDIAADPLWADYVSLAAAAGVAACWSEPIRSAEGAAIGAFAIYHPTPVVPTEEDIGFIEAASELAAIAIERRRADEALVESRQLALRLAKTEREAARNLTSFFDVSLDLLCIRDRDGRFVKANSAWATILGYQPDELAGRRLLDFIHPDDRRPTQGEMARADADGEVIGHVNRYRHRDGSYRYIEWRARRVGEQAFGVGRDVTERLAMEAEMRAARSEAEAANRAKSDFLANMSHEIRTPLNGVIGVVAALARTDLAPAQQEMIELVQQSGVTLERLVSDILDISKVEAGYMELEIQPFDLRGELEALVALHADRARRKGLGFHADFGARTQGVFGGDPTRLKQVLGNLLSNAVKFTAQGEVRLHVDLVEAETAGAPAQVAFEVEDTGVGFAPDQAGALFQRFSQADTSITRRFGGTGLGLSICKSLVELMGGEISAHSTPGEGSRFRFTLPLVREAAFAEGETAALGQPAPAMARGLRILLAEDHAINRKVVELILQPLGAEIVTVETGVEAVAAFAAERFDLVLMDMQMPVMDGLAATRALRRHEASNPDRPRTPVVMLSANAMRQHQADAREAGADRHLAKPVTAESLIRGIEAALAGAEVEASRVAG